MNIRKASCIKAAVLQAHPGKRGQRAPSQGCTAVLRGRCYLACQTAFSKGKKRLHSHPGLLSVILPSIHPSPSPSPSPRPKLAAISQATAKDMAFYVMSQCSRGKCSVRSRPGPPDQCCLLQAKQGNTAYQQVGARGWHCFRRLVRTVITTCPWLPRTAADPAPHPHTPACEALGAWLWHEVAEVQAPPDLAAWCPALGL